MSYNPHKIYEIGFIGAGNMAQAIGLAFVKKGKFNKLLFLLYCILNIKNY